MSTVARYVVEVDYDESTYEVPPVPLIASYIRYFIGQEPYNLTSRVYEIHQIDPPVVPEGE